MAATTTTAYDERHSLLARLREEPLGHSDASLLCVMDGLNRVCDLHSPTQLHWPSAVVATERLERAVELVGRLLNGSRQLPETLELLRIRGLLRWALDGIE